MEDKDNQMRTETECCQYCKFWFGIDKKDWLGDLVGECHRYPPVHSFFGDEFSETGWKDYCGEHKIK
jgi:hypothetical protein